MSAGEVRGPLPPGWAWSTLGEVADIQLGKMLDRGKASTDASFPYLRNANVQWNRIALDDLLTMPFSEAERKKFSLRAGDILVCEGGEPGRSCIWDGSRTDVHFQKALVRMRSTANVEPRWLVSWLRLESINGSLELHFSGTTIKHLPAENLSAVPVPLPPLAEQRRIVAKLDAVMAQVREARAALEAVPALLEQYRRAVLAAAFRGELTADWRAAHPDAAGTKVVLLMDVTCGLSYGSSTKSSKAGRVPVLRMGNIQDGTLLWDDLVYTSDETEIDKYRLVPGDVLFNRTNSPALVGKSAVFRSEREAVFAGYLIRVKCGPCLVPEYLNICLGSPEGRDFCWRVKSDGVSQSNISASKLADFSFPLPPLAEQHEIVRRVEAALGRIARVKEAVEAQRQQLDALERAVLDKAFRGALVPQHPDDEPAEAMLARLRAQRAAAGIAPKGRRGRPRGAGPEA